MDDNRCRAFFCQPTNPYQRRYEAVRAVFLENRSQKEVAQHFGFAYSSLRQLVYDFRQHIGAAGAASPFFQSHRLDARSRPCHATSSKTLRKRVRR